MFVFEFAHRANVNVGVVASMFPSVVIFNAILFYFVYGETLSWKKMVGMALIIAGVAAISYNDSTSEGEDQVDYPMLYLSVFFTMCMTATWSTNGLITRYYTSKADFTPVKLEIDANLLSAFC